MPYLPKAVRCPQCGKIVHTYNAAGVSSGGYSGIMCSNCKIRIDIAFTKGDYKIVRIRKM